MPFLYEGPDATVTDEEFEALTPYPQRFRVAELVDVHVVRHAPDRTALVSLQAATVAVILVILSWSSLKTIEEWLIAGVLVGTPTVVSGACMKIRPRTRELRATYHNHEVSLFASEDVRVFNRVQHALESARRATGASLETRPG